MTTALTAPQLATYRAANRWRKYYLAISKPATVYTARVNGTPTSNDGVTSIPFDGGTGDLADIMPGMSCYVGSSAGAYDKGIVRVRATPSASPLLIGVTSNVAFADNDYLTIVDDFRIWPKEPATVGGVYLMDTDAGYNQITSNAPIVRAGPPAVVLELTGATVSHSPSISAWSPINANIDAYLTTAPGASATADLDTATPTITYNAIGEYYERYTVTDSGGAVGYRTAKVFVTRAGATAESTLSLQPDETTAQDCYIVDATPTTNYNDGVINVGQNNSNARKRRGLLRFDLSSIPAGSVITSASVYLKVQADYSSNARPYKFYPVLRNWTETGATWNTYDGTNAWATAGGFGTGDVNSTAVASVTMGASVSVGTEVEFSLDTDHIQAWINGEMSNYGWLIKADTETNDGYNFYSSADATEGNRPRIVVTYISGDPAQVSPPQISGDVDSGGWEFDIEGYSGVDTTALLDNTLVVLYSRDYVGTASAAGQGFYADALNVRAVGWLDGQTLRIETDREQSTASFTVRGPAAWLDKISGPPMTINDTTGTPSGWEQWNYLTTDAALYRIAKWHSTLAEVCDVTFTGNTTRLQFAVINTGSLRSQMDGIAEERLLARLVFDRFGCGFVFVPVSLKDSVTRAAVPVLLDIDNADWQNIDIERVTATPAGLTEINGDIWDGTGLQLSDGTFAPEAVYSRAPGNFAAQFGEVSAAFMALAVASQEDCNRIAGDMHALENNEYPDVNITFANVNDYLDIAPAQVVRVTVAAGDTPRGIVWADKRLVPQAIQVTYDETTGAEGMEVSFAAETDGTDGVTYFPPPPTDGTGTAIPDTPAVSWIGIGDWFPDGLTEGPAGTCYDVANRFGLSWSKWKILGTDSDRISRAYFPCKIRAASFTYGSQLSIPIRWADDIQAYKADAQGAFACYAIDSGGSRVLTGTVSAGDNVYNPTVVTFEPVGATDVAGFEIELASGAGGGTPYAFTLGDEVASGTVDADDDAGATISGLSVGNYYAIDATGGPWSNAAVDNNYFFSLALNSVDFDGRVGYGKRAAGDDDYHFYYEPPTGYGLLQQASVYHGRVIFQATTTSVKFRVADSGDFSDNTGSLGYLVRDAIAQATRKIDIGTSQVKNVCEAG